MYHKKVGWRERHGKEELNTEGLLQETYPSSIPCGPRLGPSWAKLGPKWAPDWPDWGPFGNAAWVRGW